MQILLFGKSGQVGWELQRALAPLGKITALDSRSTEWCGDLQNQDGLIETIRNIKPDIIVNAAAYTAVDKAESEFERASIINTLAVSSIAKEAKKLGALFVHYSTDYVYSGDGTSQWKETDSTCPQNAYGLTKRAGEEGIVHEDGNYLIFRTSWVYASRGNNFIKTMLRLANEKKSLSIINDQIGAPTSAALIADITAHAIRNAVSKPELRGIYNLAAAGETSWFTYANLIFSEAKKNSHALKIEEVTSITTAEYITPAIRPLNSRLDLSKLESTFDLVMPNWEDGVKFTVNEMLTK